MAEQTVIVCDVCAKPATERVTFKARDRTLQKDLCDEHLGELMKGSRAAKRGRRPALAASALSESPLPRNCVRYGRVPRSAFPRRPLATSSGVFEASL